MKNIELKNKFLSIKINLKGAELSSFYNKKDGIEHVWQADANIWARHAPILFPIVGKVKNDEYYVGDKKYKLTQHGFARDSIFELDKKTDTKAVFKLIYNKKSLDIYPFKFCLYVEYILKNYELHIKYTVENLDKKNIYFSLGAHPAFNIPFYKKDNFDDYYLEFDTKEKADRLLLSKNGLRNEKIEKNYINNSKILELKYSIFDDDALIFEKLNSNSISIKSKKHKSYISIGINDAPLLGIWTMPKKNAPYICIEPWHGITDSEKSTGIYNDKKAINSLGIGAKFTQNLSIEIHTK